MMALGEPVSFKVKALDHHTLPITDAEASVAFKLRVEEANRVQQVISNALQGASNELRLMRKAITQMEQPEESWLGAILTLEDKIQAISLELSGDPINSQLDIDVTPSIAQRIGIIAYESKYSSANPTGTHLRSLDIAQKQLADLVPQVRSLIDTDFRMFREKLQAAGAPYVPNMLPAFKVD